MTKNDAAFFFQLPSTLLEDLRNLAEENALSTSAFIRQSIARNIRAYHAVETAQTFAKERSAIIRQA